MVPQRELHAKLKRLSRNQSGQRTNQAGQRAERAEAPCPSARHVRQRAVPAS